MSTKSAIEWTERTWNPVVGCSRVSEGCRHCYAEVMAGRQREMGTVAYQGLTTGNGSKARWTNVVRCLPERLREPLSWRKPCRCFVNSMSDLFHEAVPFEFIDQVFAVMAVCPHVEFQILTKRPERAAEYSERVAALDRGSYADLALFDLWRAVLGDGPGETYPRPTWPLRNVIGGPSVENQAAAVERLAHLEGLRGLFSKVMVSCEPLLGPVSMSPYGDVLAPGIDWVIVGGESGVGARPMHPDWARSLRDQCAAAGVPFFFKQWGAWVPMTQARPDEMGIPLRNFNRVVALHRDGFQCDKETTPIDAPGVEAMIHVGKKFAGRLLDGVKHDEYPKSFHHEEHEGHEETERVGR